MGVRIRKNNIPRVITKLKHNLDTGVDRAGDELAPMLFRSAHTGPYSEGVSQSTVENRTPGVYHTAVGIGIHKGAGFYVRFYEWGTSQPNAFGNVIDAEPNVTTDAELFTPIFVGRITQEIQRACR